MFFFICRFLEIKICLKVKRNFLKHILKPKKTKNKTKQKEKKKDFIIIIIIIIIII